MDTRKASIALLALLCGLVLANAVLAQDGYDLSWWTVDGGGTASSAEGYTLTGAIGQPDADLLVGGGYTLSGGFWAGLLARYESYLPLIMRYLR